MLKHYHENTPKFCFATKNIMNLKNNLFVDAYILVSQRMIELSLYAQLFKYDMCKVNFRL